MNENGVADLDAGVKMKPIGVRMKPTGVNLNDILYFDPDTVVIMPGTVYFNPNAEVKTVDNEVGMKPHGQNLVGRFCFNVSDRKRILNNIHRDRAMPCLY